MARKSRSSDGVPIKDTRGLPFGIDPRMFYEYSSQKRRRSSDGLEGLLYKLMPYNLIGSVAFAVDPLSQFKVSATRISPATRNRSRFGTSVTGLRSYTQHRHYFQYSTKIPIQPATTTDTDTVFTQIAQPSMIDRSSDITALDRPQGSTMGEFSSWKSRPWSSSRSAHRHDYIEGTYTDAQGRKYFYLDHTDYNYSMRGPSGYISRARVETLRNQIESRALAVMQANVLRLYKGCSAQKKATTLFRNAVELRDLPKSVLQLKETLINLRNWSVVHQVPQKLLEQLHSFKTNLRDIPKEYVSYAFGWRQTYSDLQDLLLSTERISKRINFLIRRNGKATTYRAQAKVPGAFATTSGFDYAMFNGESSPIIDSNVVYEHNLRMVINTTFEFPEVDTPTFRKKEFIRQLGVVPSPMDLYNLTPWTWLVDWFTGLGNYLETIERINTDRELINWGLLTCVTEGRLQTTMQTKMQTTEQYGAPFGPILYYHRSNSHASILSFSHHLRRDVSDLYDVGTAGDTTTLSPYQLSILGALLAMRARF